MALDLVMEYTDHPFFAKGSGRRLMISLWIFFAKRSKLGIKLSLRLQLQSGRTKIKAFSWT